MKPNLKTLAASATFMTVMASPASSDINQTGIDSVHVNGRVASVSVQRGPETIHVVSGKTYSNADLPSGDGYMTVEDAADAGLLTVDYSTAENLDRMLQQLSEQMKTFEEFVLQGTFKNYSVHIVADNVSFDISFDDGKDVAFTFDGQRVDHDIHCTFPSDLGLNGDCLGDNVDSADIEMMGNVFYKVDKVLAVVNSFTNQSPSTEGAFVSLSGGSTLKP